MRHIKTFEKVNLDWIKDKLGLIDKELKYAGKDPDNIDPFKEEDWGYAERERLKRIEAERIAEMKRQREMEKRRMEELIRRRRLEYLEKIREKYKKYLDSTPYQIVDFTNRDFSDKNFNYSVNSYYIDITHNGVAPSNDIKFKIDDCLITKKYEQSKEFKTVLGVFGKNLITLKIKDLESAFEWISKNWEYPMESEEIKEIQRKKMEEEKEQRKKYELEREIHRLELEEREKRRKEYMEKEIKLRQIERTKRVRGIGLDSND